MVVSPQLRCPVRPGTVNGVQVPAIIRSAQQGDGAESAYEALRP
jgi:hypothetical protein